MAPKTDIKDILGSDEASFMLDSLESEDSIIDDSEVLGQLAVDVFQTEKDVVVKAPIAGVKGDELDITITDELVSIKGERKEEKEVDNDGYYMKECYWGSFSRSVALPSLVLPDKATATFKKGILTIRIPKANQSKLRKLKVEIG